MIALGGDGLRQMPAVQQQRASNIARLKLAELFLVTIAHDLSIVVWMVQADSVADLMRDRVAEVIDLQISVEANLPLLQGIETD